MRSIVDLSKLMSGPNRKRSSNYEEKFIRLVNYQKNNQLEEIVSLYNEHEDKQGYGSK
jgi:hypothetical protein